jgi:hypothetical protein
MVSVGWNHRPIRRCRDSNPFPQSQPKLKTIKAGNWGFHTEGRRDEEEEKSKSVMTEHHVCNTREKNEKGVEKSPADEGAL